MNSTYFDIRFLDIFHFVAFLFLTIRVAFILHSNRFLISSFFVFYCFTFAFFCCHLYLFQFCFFSSLTADPLRIQSTKGPAPKFPFFKKCSLDFQQSRGFVFNFCAPPLLFLSSKCAFKMDTFHFSFLVFNEYQLDEIRLSEFSMKR